MSDYKPTNADPVCDPALAKRATLEALAVALDGNWSKGSPDGGTAVKAALDAYRIECRPPRRTKAEVDADIVDRIRGWSDAGCGLMLGQERLIVLRALCEEPYGPTGAAAKESREDIAAPGGATSNPCSVPEAEPARQGRTCDLCDDTSYPPLQRVEIPAHIEWLCARCFHGRGVEASPEPHPDDRPCGCEETEALKSKLESQGRLLEECANTLAIAGYGELAWRAHAMRKATRA